MVVLKDLMSLTHFFSENRMLFIDDVKNFLELIPKNGILIEHVRPKFKIFDNQMKAHKLIRTNSTIEKLYPSTDENIGA